MADKEMIAATLAAGVLAAAPPVLDPLAAAKEAASLCTESPPSTRTRSPGSQGLAGESAPRGFCPPVVQIPVPSSVRTFQAAVSECSMRT